MNIMENGFSAILFSEGSCKATAKTKNSIKCSFTERNAETAINEIERMVRAMSKIIELMLSCRVLCRVWQTVYLNLLLSANNCVHLLLCL
jgi:hypothetical protein